MCKRPCFDNDYLPTYNRPNVHLVDTKGKGITEINAAGPIFDGKAYELDLLICATGFEVQKTGIYNQIRGVDGLDLNEKYGDGIRTLLAGCGESDWLRGGPSDEGVHRPRGGARFPVRTGLGLR